MAQARPNSKVSTRSAARPAPKARATKAPRSAAAAPTKRPATPRPRQAPPVEPPTQRPVAVAPRINVPRTSGLAIAALVLGILWMFGLGSFLAVVFGAIALRTISRSGGAVGGKGMAVAGLVLGIVGMIGATLIVAGMAAVDDALDEAATELSTETTSDASAEPTSDAPTEDAPVAEAPAEEAPPAPTAPVEQSTPAPAPASDPNVVSDKGFEVVSFEASEEEFSGDWTGRAQIKNTGASRTASWTFTLFHGDKIVGTLTGMANDMASGQTMTIELVSTDDFVPGDFVYRFQTDFEF